MRQHQYLTLITMENLILFVVNIGMKLLIGRNTKSVMFGEKENTMMISQAFLWT
ncbi:hypothetical protein ES703_78907 [subsurface metagenome]